jgi:predicted CXXCH cytochrome family protein
MSKLRFSLAGVLMLILLAMFAAVASAEVQLPSNVGTIDNFGNQNTHRTHGNFQNNTNSCANCHSTHNGETSTLLMKSGEYELCMSCHDGTMGFYNVSIASEAGIFDESHSPDMSASMHNVDSELAVKSAPGALANTSTATFECSSCHNPHGSANDRLLNENVAGKQYGGTYNVTIVGYTETITKLTTVPTGQKAIKLNLVEDPAYADINNSSNLSGLKIYKSNGIYNAATADVPLNKVYDYKLNFSAFCSSCHDDYLKNRENEARSIKSAEGHTLYTHTTSSTKAGRSCTACHYSHGTDITTLRDTAGKTIADYKAAGWTDEQAKAYMKDVSSKGSSLKRFTNMAVCWACHQSTHAIADTPGTSTYPASGLVPGGNYSGKALIK